eukprot:SAG31_NODE_1514_length_8042_cov_6.955936_8_plen_210_part_00
MRIPISSEARHRLTSVRIPGRFAVARCRDAVAPTFVVVDRALSQPLHDHTRWMKQTFDALLPHRRATERAPNVSSDAVVEGKSIARHESGSTRAAAQRPRRDAHQGATSPRRTSSAGASGNEGVASLGLTVGAVVISALGVRQLVKFLHQSHGNAAAAATQSTYRDVARAGGAGGEDWEAFDQVIRQLDDAGAATAQGRHSSAATRSRL